jgi:hypothetical protein
VELYLHSPIHLYGVCLIKCRDICNLLSNNEPRQFPYSPQGGEVEAYNGLMLRLSPIDCVYD